MKAHNIDMNIIDRFSSSQGRRDQIPNRMFAKEIIISADHSMIEELFQVLLDWKTGNNT